MALSFAFRHYYSEVTYDKFFTLEENGDLISDETYATYHNATYNSWNIDLRFSWWFAPGSQLSLLYRNSMESYDEISRMSFNDNFDLLFEQPQLNSISLRVSYFLDYNRMKNWFKKRPEMEDISTKNSYQQYKTMAYKRKG